MSFKMKVVHCSKTLGQNFEYNLYYDKAEKGFTDHKYLGIYGNKSVRGIGELVNIITADLQLDGELNIIAATNKVTKEHIQNIKNAIRAAKQNNHCDISRGYNFFCVDKFYETHFQKTSKHSLQGSKFFNLKQTLKVRRLPETATIASLLEELEW